MGARRSLQVLERVSEVATLAGMSGKIEDDRMQFVMGFALPEGRGQVVYVRDISKDDDHPVVTIFSPCGIVKKSFFGGFSKKRAIELLRLNEHVLFARFGIWENKVETMVVASTDHLLETLDPDELKTSAFNVAFAADSYEKKYGQDNF